MFSPPFKVSMDGEVLVVQVTYIDEVPTGGYETTNFSPTLFKAFYSSLSLSLSLSPETSFERMNLNFQQYAVKTSEIYNGPHTVEILSLI